MSTSKPERIPSEHNGSEVSVSCLGLAHGGTMICQVTEGPETLVGKKAFVAGLIPGESGTIVVREDRRSFVEGDLLSIGTPAPQRVSPPCPVFNECGGCDLQYMPIAMQREYKRLMVETTLQRQAGLVLTNPVELLGADLPAFAYRKRISLHLNSLGEIGFYREGSGDVVPISRCLIASDAVNTTLHALQKISFDLAKDIGGITIEEFCDYGVPIFILHEAFSLAGLTELTAHLKAHFSFGKVYKGNTKHAEWSHQLSADQLLEFSTLSHFSQINEAGNSLLTERVVEHLKAYHGVTEFYAGSGNFSFPLARLGKGVDAIEVDRQLVARGAELAHREGLDRLEFFAESAERFFSHSKRRVRESVLLDPPRSGAKVVSEQLSPNEVEAIVYVSCALPTLARDLATMVKNGFVLERVAIVDMFPQTHHVESVAFLRRA